MDGIGMLKDPGTGKEIQMRIGCHSGAVVAGIVGLKMPRLYSHKSNFFTQLLHLLKKTVFKKGIVCSV